MVNMVKVNKKKSVCCALCMMPLLIAADQVTKLLTLHYLSGGRDVVLIPGVLRLTYVENRGAAFGILQGKTVLFLLLTVVILLFLARCYLKLLPERRYRLLRILCTAVGAGAVGNLIDRMRLGFVVDMIYFELIHFPVFNVADCYITVSAFVLVAAILFYYKDDDFSCLSFSRKRKDSHEA